MLEKLKLKNNDTCIFLGDYIDRGAYSKEVVSRLIELSKEVNCIFLKGNHEAMLLKAKTNEFKDITKWYLDGGDTTLKSYGADVKYIFNLHGKFFENLKLYYMTDIYLFIHAGVRPDKHLNEQEEYDMLWIRDNFIYKKHCLKQKVIFGHTPFYNPYIEDDKIGINTGCGIEPDCCLTALICNDETFVHSDNNG